MPSSRATVIVLNWNGRHHLEECLGSVLAQDLAEPFEVVLWDNGSTDGSQAFVRSRFPKVRLVEAGENLGFAQAMDRAVAEAASEYVVLLNNDTRAEPGWLRTLVEAADRSPPDVASIGSRLVLHGRPHLLHHAGGLLSPFGGAFDEGLGQPVAAFADRPDLHETGASCGGAALYRRATFLELGGFDPRFFLYFEDADFCRRAWLAGHRTLHASRSVVSHKLGATSGGLLAPARMRHAQQNRILMLHQCSPTGRVTLRLLGALVWTLAAATALLPRRPRAAAALLAGTWNGLRRLPAARRRRRAVQATRRVSEAALRRRGLVVSARRAFRESRRLAALGKQP